MQERAKHEKFNFVWLDDGPKQELSHKVGPVATPHVFIFDKSRKLRFEGRIDDSERESCATTHDTRARSTRWSPARNRRSPPRACSAAR